jgi:TonB family protein
MVFGLLLASRLALAQGDAEITHPVAVHQVEATYPDGLSPQHADVILIVTLDAQGNVTDVKVETSGGAAFDDAAVQAVKKWTFSPATKNGRPFAARMKIPFHFEPPKPPEPTPQEPPPPPPEKIPPKQQTTPPPPQPKDPSDVEDVHVYGPASPPIVGVCDVRFHGGEIWSSRATPQDNATKLLQTATPILITNEGGEGHAEAIFSRGFDAREGQDIEITANGVPVNEAGNLHTNGYADTHFIIPELVRGIRVVEGPFDPRQGNFAVVGTADYQLGLDQRGVIAKYTGGAWNTHRALALWGPEGTGERTFAGAEMYTTDGFGQNRAAIRGSAMGQYEGKLGDKGIWHLGVQGYASRFQTPGVVREDDVKAGRIGFYDSYDGPPHSIDALPQGGDASRFSAWGDIETKLDETTLRQQVFVIKKDMRLLENFTGFLLDPRGDELDLNVNSLTVGARGSARFRTKALGQRQELEVGYYARVDDTHDTQQRIAAATGNPYQNDTDDRSTLGDVGLYADTNLKPLKWLTLNGGVRSDIFTFDVFDGIAGKRVSNAAIALMPRGSLVVGPFEGFSLGVSAGSGVQSVDPEYVVQNPTATPYTNVVSYEAGASFTRVIGGQALVVARSVFFDTHVDNDVFFSEDEGRNVLGVGTTRTGWLGTARVTGKHFDVSANATIVKSQYDDTHLPVAYAPPLVLRGDAVVFGDLPIRIDGTKIHAALGSSVTYAAPRPLPFGLWSDEIFSLDASLDLRWRRIGVAVTATNITNNEYRIAEFAYVSDFHTGGTTTAPVRTFNAAPPLGVFASLSVRLGGAQ